MDIVWTTHHDESKLHSLAGNRSLGDGCVWCGTETAVLLAPDCIDPRLEAIAHRSRLGDRCSEEFSGYLEPAHVHVDSRNIACEELPQRHIPSGIGEGHVKQGVELIAEAGENEGDAPDAWPQKMLVRRILVRLFFPREARSLQKAGHGDRDVLVSLAYSAE